MMTASVEHWQRWGLQALAWVSNARMAAAAAAAGDATGALLWAVALWYLSPVQLLLVFLGNFDTERPSDWLMNILGRATQQP